MDILFVTQASPNAEGQGWERRAAQHIRALSKLGHVHVWLPWQEEEFVDADAYAHCRDMGATFVTRRSDPPLSDSTAAAQVAANGRLPRAWRSLRRVHRLDARVQPQDRRDYREWLSARRFDMVFAFKMQSAIWIDSVLQKAERPPVAVVDFDDIESAMFAPVVRSPGLSLFWSWKLKRWLHWLVKTEKRLLENWSAASVCSELDAGRMEVAHGVRPWIVPNGYKFEDTIPEAASLPAKVLFVGTFSYPPNVDGVLWFVNEIWPRVHAALGDQVELTLAGFNPPPAIIELGERSGISVIADAPDLGPLYAQANIIIAPLLAGSGTRIKLIEAAAKQRSIVTTTLGCEGLDFVDGVHAEVADTPADFADRVIGLAKDPAQRDALARAARAHASQQFDTNIIEADLAARVASLSEDRQ